MRQIFPTDPRVLFREPFTALSLRARLGRDANGRTLQTELNDVLARAGCDEPTADFWRDLVAAADDEAAAIHAEELDATLKGRR